MNFPDFLRKHASIERGRRIFEGPVPQTEVDAVSLVLMQKAACADLGLLKIAAEITGPEEDILSTYERLGGTFKKEAIGAPMFQAPQLPQMQSPSQRLGTTPIGAPPVQQPGVQQPTAPNAQQPQQPKTPNIGAAGQGQPQTPGTAGTSGG